MEWSSDLYILYCFIIYSGNGNATPTIFANYVWPSCTANTAQTMLHTHSQLCPGHTAQPTLPRPYCTASNAQTMLHNSAQTMLHSQLCPGHTAQLCPDHTAQLCSDHTAQPTLPRTYCTTLPRPCYTTLFRPCCTANLANCNCPGSHLLVEWLLNNQPSSVNSIRNCVYCILSQLYLSWQPLVGWVSVE